MIKPTEKQLKKLYPDIDVSYLNDHIDRKITLINMEDEVIKQIEDVLTQFKELISGVLFLPYTTDVKQTLLKQKFNDLEVQLANLEVDGIIQLHESSGYLYQWILEKHFSGIPTKEFGGEQVSRKNILKQDIQNLVSRTVNRNQNVGNTIETSLGQFSNSINRLNTEKFSQYEFDRLFSQVQDQIVGATRSVLQQAVYDAELGTQVTVDEQYEIVYYRVEVLDNSICMNCMSLDGSVNRMPLGLIHKNCRGIDVLLLKDMETGKYYDSSYHGFGHKMRTKSFTDKFESLSEKQKRSMLGKTNYELYSSGKLNAEDFLDNGRQITTGEAKIFADLKSLRKDINTPQKANAMKRYMESLFGNKPMTQMSAQELSAYEKCLGIQKQIYMNVPNKAYSKTKPKQTYIDAIDAKYDELNKLRSQN